MSWINWACVGLIVLGFVLFLYGSNSYEAGIGFAGLFLLVVGIVGALVVYVYSELTKRGS